MLNIYNVISRSNCFVLVTKEEVTKSARLKVSVYNKKHCYIDVTMRKKFLLASTCPAMTEVFVTIWALIMQEDTSSVKHVATNGI